MQIIGNARRRARVYLLFWSTAVVLSCLVPRHAVAEPRVELITIDSGDAIWTRFGHIALRVIDSAEDRDDIYNFGYAPFDQADFLWGYLRGTAHFYLAREPFERVLARYVHYDRTVRARPLNLSVDEAFLVASMLKNNARLENREYRYDHLSDNCSTRVRDLLDAVSNGALRRAANDQIAPSTFRPYTLEAGSGNLLTHIIFDMIGGPNQEREVDGWTQLYMPSRLEEAAVATQITGTDGVERPLLGEPVVVYARQKPWPTSGELYTGRWALVLIGLSLGLLLWLGLRTTARSDGALAGLSGRLTGLLILPISLIFGVLGLCLLGLVVFSRVPDFRWNENLLVFWPTDLLWSVTTFRLLVLGRRHVGKLFKNYAVLRLVGLGLLAVAKLAGVMPQDNWAFMACAAGVVAGMAIGGREKSSVS